MTKLHDRLINENRNKNMERERIKRHAEEIEQNAYPYKPVISEVSEKILLKKVDRDRPIHERLEDMSRRKNEDMARLRLEVEEAQNFEFKPKISRTSESIAQQRRIKDSEENLKPEDRLLKKGKEYGDRKAKKEVEREENMCTFVPDLQLTEQENMRYDIHQANMFGLSVGGKDDMSVDYRKRNKFEEFLQRQNQFIENKKDFQDNVSEEK